MIHGCLKFQKLQPSGIMRVTKKTHTYKLKKVTWKDLWRMIKAEWKRAWEMYI